MDILFDQIIHRNDNPETKDAGEIFSAPRIFPSRKKEENR